MFFFINLAQGQDYFKLGNDEFAKGNYEKAIEYYTQYIQKSPGPEAYNNRGVATEI